MAPDDDTGYRGQMFLGGFEETDPDPDRDTWTTPGYICEAIGEVDLDPCNNERAKVITKKAFRLERGQDGLALARFVGKSTRTFVNCPYSRGQVEKWVLAYRHTRFIFLLRLDTSTTWFKYLMERTSIICVLRERRMNFDPPPGAVASSAVFPHALFFASEEDVTPKIREICYQWRVCQ